MCSLVYAWQEIYDMTLLESFDPVIKKNCRVLILGSMPGVASLQQQQYYAHPRNVFWTIMDELFGIDRGGNYDERCTMLTDCGLGVWDVLKRCKRTGSLDSSIEPATEQINDFIRLFSDFGSVRAVFFNGGAAERLYKKHVLCLQGIIQYNLLYQKLPSTSPAYAAMNFDQKLELWRGVLG